MKNKFMRSCFSYRSYPSVILQVAIFNEYVIKIMKCRPGLDRVKLEQAIKKQASYSISTINDMAAYCSELAREGKPFPWE